MLESFPVVFVDRLREESVVVPDLHGDAIVPSWQWPHWINLDGRMPRMEGIGLTRYLNVDKETRQLPIWLMSMSSETILIDMAYDLEASMVMCKVTDFTILRKQACQ